MVTIEGLAKGEVLHPIQEAFVEEGASQCGYCTSGMILTAAALLKETSHPTDVEIVEAMNGNICRCNHYPKILKAVHSAGKKDARLGRQGRPPKRRGLLMAAQQARHSPFASGPSKSHANERSNLS